MTSAVYRGRKAVNQTNKQKIIFIILEQPIFGCFGFAVLLLVGVLHQCCTLWVSFVFCMNLSEIFYCFTSYLNITATLL